MLLNFLISPKGSSSLFGGVILVVLANRAERSCLSASRDAEEDSQPARTRNQCGVRYLMGISYPFIVKAITGDHSLGPYAVSFIFALGIALCAIPVNYYFMRRPLTGQCAGGHAKAYFDAGGLDHFWEFVGGTIWCTGTTLLHGFPRANHSSNSFLCNWPRGNDAIRRSGVYLSGVNFPMRRLPRATILPDVSLLIVGLVAVAIAPVWGK